MDSGVKRISVLGEDSIVVGQNLLEFIPKDVLASVPAAKYAIVTDENLAPIYLPTLLAGFEKLGVTLLSKVLPPGEQTKCRKVKEEIEDWLLENHCNRDSCLLAMGGGVIGDLTGFVAATYMRGIPFVQIPTSLLAMVDSSVGGKTGIDTPHGKNLIGAFHQPKRIYMSMTFLQSLPKRQLFNGMAECIKTAAIWDEFEFEYLENNSDRIISGDTEALMRIVIGSAGVKAQVVTADEKEGGLRGLLNFGHTIGHAVEALCQPEMLHGEAVAIGMAREAELARAMGVLTQANVGRLVRCLQLYGLDPTLPRHLSVPDMMEKMAVDKKNKGGKKAVVILKEVGAVLEKKAVGVEDGLIERVLCEHVVVVSTEKGVEGTVRVPGSKSISNRALLLAGLASGTCKISGLLHSDDTKVMLDALKAFGVTYETEEGGETLVINGSGGALTAPNKEVYLGNAGTASRFLTSACTLLPPATTCVITGNARMKQRPIGPLVDALRSNGAHIEYKETDGCLPLAIEGGGFKGGSMALAANISSQYVSSILISAPYAQAPVNLDLTGGEVVSQPYIDMTLQLLSQFGVNAVRRPETNTYDIPKQTLANPNEFLVEGDASSATYPLAIAAITGGTVTVDNVGSRSLQGDAAFCRLLESMGCTVSQSETTTTVTGPPRDQRLKPIKIDMMTMTDAFMTAAVLAAVADGTSQLTGIANQRVKECDRLAVMVEELGKLGVKARELPDGIEIEGKAPNEIKGNVVIKCHDDHRIAMSFAVLGCRVSNILISEKHCVEKTYPEFWDHLESLLKVNLRVPPPEEVSKAKGPSVAEVEPTAP
eukprot:comp23872_c0_seq2/m.41864 comp23872_c0_seq2/g.41864  ORF comp23872_c0_seq2/g.41864 comp23872_c0_seq2/m.41864 type:complete len:823 (-) comp23872_c0_seq2:45-2513(-)